MTNTHEAARPILLRLGETANSIALDRVAVGQPDRQGGYREDLIQELVFRHPNALPIDEIDRSFEGAVPICRELGTSAGPIDCLLVNEKGLPILVECKLWRNPEARRKVVGQILDYAKELGSWSYGDLQRQVSVKLGRSGNALYHIVKERYPNLDESRFVDSVSRNLRRGRFLLLIVGDGIREGVEAIAEFVQRHSGLHFTFGLVELPIFDLPNGDRIVTPRILARSTIIGRNVLVLTDDRITVDTPRDGGQSEVFEDESSQAALDFWSRFLSDLNLDDPDQDIPRPSTRFVLSFLLQTPGNTNWITVYRLKRDTTVGVFLGGTRGTLGHDVMNVLERDKDEILREIGEPVEWRVKDGKPGPACVLQLSDFDDSEEIDEAFKWLRERVNAFVNVLRPRVESALEELTT